MIFKVLSSLTHPMEGAVICWEGQHFRWEGPVMVRLTRILLKSSMGFQDAKEEKQSPQALGALSLMQKCFILTPVMMSAFSIHCHVTDPHEFLPCACASLICFHQHPGVIYY